VRLEEAHDSIGNVSAVCVIENGLLANQLTDHQKLLVDRPSGGQKAATASDQGVNARKTPPQVTDVAEQKKPRINKIRKAIKQRTSLMSSAILCNQAGGAVGGVGMSAVTLARCTRVE
jgi:hypothetical protein